MLKNTPADLPKDYWSFLQIHNGFGRLAEIGLLPVDELEDDAGAFDKHSPKFRYSLEMERNLD